MVTAWIRLRSLAALLALGSLALSGCKQDIGGRCEQASDCASGVCGSVGSADMASAAGKVCVSGAAAPVDASGQSPVDAANQDLGVVYGSPDAADGTSSETAGMSEVHEEVHAEVHAEAAAEASTSDGADGASTATEVGAD
jgi:hypothetical protein